MEFVLLCIVVGILVGSFVGKNISAPIAKNQTSKQSANTPSPANIWWDNLKHTPLGEQESRQIAAKVADLYIKWKNDSFVNHSWLCLGIDSNQVVFKQIYSCTDVVKFAPTPTISFSHAISCQNDRELLASYILSAIKTKDPGCMLFLDGDSLILPTNCK